MKKSLVVFFGLMVFAASQAANATTIFNLTSDHCSNAGGCGPEGAIFGTVTLTQDGTSVDFVVDLNDPYVWAKTGAADFMAFKFNATGVVVGDITVDQTFAGRTLVAQTGSFNGDGTGPFNFGINCIDCANGLSDPVGTTIPAPLLTFTVANATIAELTAPNVPNGNVFVADIGNSLTGATGPVDATVGVVVPDGGSTLTLLGSALLGLGMLRRRFGKS